MGRSGDEQVGDSAPMGASCLDHGGFELAVATHGSDIEGDWFEGPLELLQSDLTASSPRRSPSQIGSGGSEFTARVVTQIAASSGRAALTSGSSQSTTTDVSSRPAAI